ncbi:UNVERIFIED_CONTAM: hypothetical protein NCL1_25433 [Trichonephila clavipes]
MKWSPQSPGLNPTKEISGNYGEHVVILSLPTRPLHEQEERLFHVRSSHPVSVTDNLIDNTKQIEP